MASGRFDDIGGSSIQNPYDRRAEWGPADGLSRHRTVGTVVWEVPVGRGRKFGGNMHPALNVVAGDWTISNYSGWRSGGRANESPPLRSGLGCAPQSASGQECEVILLPPS